MRPIIFFYVIFCVLLLRVSATQGQDPSSEAGIRRSPAIPPRRPPPAPVKRFLEWDLRPKRPSRVPFPRGSYRLQPSPLRHEYTEQPRDASRDVIFPKEMDDDALDAWEEMAQCEQQLRVQLQGLNTPYMRPAPAAPRLAWLPNMEDDTSIMLHGMMFSAHHDVRQDVDMEDVTLSSSSTSYYEDTGSSIDESDTDEPLLTLRHFDLSFTDEDDQNDNIDEKMAVETDSMLDDEKQAPFVEESLKPYARATPTAQA